VKTTLSAAAAILGSLFLYSACSSDSPASSGGSSGTGAQPTGSSGASTTAGTGSGTTAGTGTGVGGSGSGTTAGTGNTTAGTSPTGTGGTPTGTGGTPTGTAGTGTGGSTNPPPGPALVTSTMGDFWKVGTFTEVTGATADVTVNDATAAQTWEGFGAAFNEKGWSVLTTPALQDEALKLLFSADGTHFSWGRIPMGASDYAMDRYTLDDTGTDVDASTGTRPPQDLQLTKFSLARDEMKLIPFIKAAQAINPALRFWASPWTPPVWMKTGYKTNSGEDSSQNAKKPSFFDGGTMLSDDATLTSYAQYFVKFVQGYKEKGINVEIVAPANEPNFDQNYPSCIWEKANYAKFIGKFLGPALMTAGLGTKIMLGTLSNGTAGKDADNAAAVLADATAKGFCTVAGAQWGMLEGADKTSAIKAAGIPLWATEHKCGNYPWIKSAQAASATQPAIPAYATAAAPNDMAYAVESWWYLKNAITTIGVTSYNAWNMVLDPSGLGIDTTRDWKQNALLVVDGGTLKKTPTYYVFRHLAQYVAPGDKVVATTGVESLAVKNTDGSIVAVVFNSGAAKAMFTVALGGKQVQFAMPANGWATVKL